MRATVDGETKNSPLLRIPRTLDIIGGGSTRMPELAAELVRRRVAVIATPGWPPAARAAKAATSTIPIVSTPFKAAPEKWRRGRPPGGAAKLVDRSPAVDRPVDRSTPVYTPLAHDDF